MHEEALARGIVRAVERAAAAEGARQVTAVRVRVPELHPLSPEHLRSHFEHAAAGTMSAGARLTVCATRDAGDVIVDEIEIADER